LGRLSNLIERDHAYIDSELDDKVQLAINRLDGNIEEADKNLDQPDIGHNDLAILNKERLEKRMCQLTEVAEDIRENIEQNNSDENTDDYKELINRGNNLMQTISDYTERIAQVLPDGDGNEVANNGELATPVSETGSYFENVTDADPVNNGGSEAQQAPSEGYLGEENSSELNNNNPESNELSNESGNEDTDSSVSSAEAPSDNEDSDSSVSSAEAPSDNEENSSDDDSSDDDSDDDSSDDDSDNDSLDDDSDNDSSDNDSDNDSSGNEGLDSSESNNNNQEESGTGNKRKLSSSDDDSNDQPTKKRQTESNSLSQEDLDKNSRAEDQEGMGDSINNLYINSDESENKSPLSSQDSSSLQPQNTSQSRGSTIDFTIEKQACEMPDLFDLDGGE